MTSSYSPPFGRRTVVHSAMVTPPPVTISSPSARHRQPGRSDAASKTERRPPPPTTRAKALLARWPQTRPAIPPWSIDNGKISQSFDFLEPTFRTSANFMRYPNLVNLPSRCKEAGCLLLPISIHLCINISRR